MNLSTGYEGRRARIEIVPLIDVVFLLLVFFIYAMLSMTVYRGVRVRLPAGSGDVEEMKTVVINIDAETKRLDVDVSDEEMARRRTEWQMPPYKATMALMRKDRFDNSVPNLSGFSAN